MNEKTESIVNATLVTIAILSALFMWRQDYGHVIMTVTSITFTVSAFALFVHFMHKLND